MTDLPTTAALRGKFIVAQFEPQLVEPFGVLLQTIPTLLYSIRGPKIWYWQGRGKMVRLRSCWR